MSKKIAYFGDESSFTYACAIENYRGCELVGYATIFSAVEAVHLGVVDGAIVPIENSVGGTVGETIDALRHHSVYISEQHYLPVVHSLIAVKGTDKKNIKRVYSHYQALSQCEKYLKRELPNATLMPVSSTSDALKMLAKKDEAAIARLPLPSQTVIESGIEDNKHNVTRFVFVEKIVRYGGKNASVTVDTPNCPGALLKVLSVFSDLGINMRKLESRPARDGEFHYWFYSEFECDGDEKTIDKILEIIKKATAGIKFLGNY